MPEISVIHIGIVFMALIIGVVVGWLFRGKRAVGEKIAISEGWREQLEAQRGEHQRLLEQNKSLMEQNSQYQASNRDAKMRASELSGALREAFERRDVLQRQLKDIRSNLEAAVAERDQLRGSTATEDLSRQLEERDARIEKLTAELRNWQERVPPLVEKFQERSAEAAELGQQLADAQERIAALEHMAGSEQTRVEPVDSAALGEALDASNETIIGEIDDVIDVGHVGDNEESSRAANGSAPEAVDDVASDGEEPLDADGATDDEARDFNDAAVESIVNESPCDDLKLIKGVGPAIEKTLNELGIRRFDQIAQMSEYDIDRVANRLKGFRSRIYREDWIGQARILLDQKVSGQM